MKGKIAVPGYLPPILYMAALARQNTLYFRNDTYFNKQTHRNRAHIYGANGLLKLTIPITHTPTAGYRKDTEVQIFNTNAWQKQHWKSLEAAYRSSPYFEFYEEDLRPFYTKQYENLFAFNCELILTLFELIGLPKEMKTVAMDGANYDDVSHFLDAKAQTPNCPEYIQVFENKHGFLSNLSCVDALFNLGPEAAPYLQSLEQTLLPN